MLDVKEAARIAREYFDGLYADAQTSNVLPEEVERAEYASSDGEAVPLWHITLGFEDSGAGDASSIEGGLKGLAAPATPSRRRYKRFEIDAGTGEVRAMKIRAVGNG